ncbi:hypothetical protein TNCV_1432621 [Trichonephila clavipes]|nr:hypothetical protein TNCV_1432621 [Trichonephila clavipes]
MSTALGQEPNILVDVFRAPEVLSIYCSVGSFDEHFIKFDVREYGVGLDLNRSSLLPKRTNTAGTKTRSAWLVTLNTVPSDLGSNPEEGMGVCKCLVPLRNRSTLNSRRAASPLVRLVEGCSGSIRELSSIPLSGAFKTSAFNPTTSAESSEVVSQPIIMAAIRLVSHSVQQQMTISVSAEAWTNGFNQLLIYKDIQP